VEDATNCRLLRLEDDTMLRLLPSSTHHLGHRAWCLQPDGDDPGALVRGVKLKRPGGRRHW
jgi:hypothetical protein